MLTGTIQIDISMHAYNNFATIPALYIGCHQPTNDPSNNGVRSLNAKDQEKKTHRKCIRNSIHGECQSENTC